MTNPKTPEATLVAVLRVLLPGARITVRGRHVVCYLKGDSHASYAFLTGDKGHLAEIVAMLSPEQRERFDLRMADITKGGAMEQDGRYPRVPASAVLTALTSTIFDALYRAVYPELEKKP